MDIERVQIFGVGTWSSCGFDNQVILFRFWHAVQKSIGTKMGITGEIHLRGQHPHCQSRGYLEMNVSRSGPIRTNGIGTRLDRLERVHAILIRHELTEISEVWIQPGGAWVCYVCVSTGATSLPDLHYRAIERLAIQIGHLAGKKNDFAFCLLAWIAGPREVVVVRRRLDAIPGVHVEGPFGLGRRFLALPPECDCWYG